MSDQSLQSQIQSFQDSFLPSVDEQTMSTIMSELQTLMQSGIAESALASGNAFPEFNLPNADNEPRNLDDYLNSGPLVISFYRGAWCPYCNLEINALQRALPDITSAGAQLVAISPQTPDKSVDQISKSQLTFDVLSDVGNKLAKSCGLVFTLPKSLRPIYHSWQLDIPGHNGDDSFELPIPATYIIDCEGNVRYDYINMDYTQRVEPSIIIEQLKSL